MEHPALAGFVETAGTLVFLEKAAFLVTRDLVVYRDSQAIAVGAETLGFRDIAGFRGRAGSAGTRDIPVRAGFQDILVSRVTVVIQDLAGTQDWMEPLLQVVTAGSVDTQGLVQRVPVRRVTLVIQGLAVTVPEHLVIRVSVGLAVKVGSLVILAHRDRVVDQGTQVFRVTRDCPAIPVTAV